MGGEFQLRVIWKWKVWRSLECYIVSLFKPLSLLVSAPPPPPPIALTPFYLPRSCSALAQRAWTCSHSSSHQSLVCGPACKLQGHQPWPSLWPEIQCRQHRPQQGKLPQGPAAGCYWECWYWWGLRWGCRFHGNVWILELMDPWREVHRSWNSHAPGIQCFHLPAMHTDLKPGYVCFTPLNAW